MTIVIIAGGSGSRLWPLSTPEYPKHLLKLTNEKSLLQNTVQRVETVTSSDKIFVISDDSHVKHVRNQLAHMDSDHILAEPGRRGTASCIAWALSILEKQGHPEDEPIFFLWADHLIRSSEGFATTAFKAGELAKLESKIVFIGVEPNYPSTGLGYIKKEQQLKDWYDVYQFGGFVEKPDHKTAQRYFDSGNYLWNTGYLVGNIKTFKKHFENDAPDMKHRFETLMNSKDLAKAYLGLEPVAVEYVFSEKIKDALVVPGNFDWMDIGSYADLHNVSFQDDSGNYITGKNVEIESTANSYVRNEIELPLAVIGLDNVIVVASENGILVTSKTHAQKVGDVSKRLQDKKS